MVYLCRWRIVGILSIISAAVLLVLAMSTSSSSRAGLLDSLWLGEAPLQTRKSESLQVNGSSVTVLNVSTSSDFEELSEKLVAEWPGTSTVITYEKQAVASDVAICSVIGK